MSTEPTQSAVLPLASSSELPQLVEIISSVRVLKEALGPVFRVRLVVDTNVVLGDILFLALKRKNPLAKPILHELVESGVAEVYAPDQLLMEVEKWLPRIAVKKRVEVGRLEHAWSECRKILRIIPTRQVDVETMSLERELRDANDLAFILAQEDVGADAIATKDQDIYASTAPVLPSLEVFIDLRRYARAKSIELKLKIGGVVVIGIGVAVLSQVVRLIAKLGRALLASPPLVKILILSLLLIPLLSKRTRARVSGQLASLTSMLGNVWDSLAPSLTAILQQHYENESGAHEALQRINSAVPKAKRRTLKVEAYTVLVGAKQPMTCGEVMKAVEKAGFTSRSKNPRDYLRRVLASDPRVERSHDDRWFVRGIGSAAA